ncbi:HK97 family phage prohead protease [Corticibacterium sp. UT-5YL-CI-8]|nr:HK97 family phage prohead protease [Tianweitania sp. UT-5YL-CI-8]
MTRTLKHPRLAKPAVQTGRRKYDRLVSSNPDAIREGLAEDLAPIYRKASFGQNSFDEATYTIDAIFSTFAPVQRRGFIEMLDPAGLDMAGIVGAPVLDGHRNSSGRHVVGVITDALIEHDQLVGTVRLVQSDDAKPIVDRIRGGFLRDVSIGYRVLQWSDSTSPETRERIRTAVRWSIFELSAVPIGADPGSKFRSFHMDPELENTELAMSEAAETAIRSIGELADLPPSWAAAQIEAEATIEEARTAARGELVKRSAPTQRIRVQAPSLEDGTALVRRQSDAMAFRMAGGTLPEDARPFVGMSLREYAAASLERAGINTRGMPVDNIFTRAGQHTTSDFPLLVSNAMGKVALESYKAAESPLKILARQRTLPNFKDSAAIRLGELGKLLPMTESGEFQHTTRAENGEILKLQTFGRAINVSRQLLIDDDLGMLGDMTAAMGQAAAQTEADELVELLLSNPNLSDGTAVFHATRGNIGAPSPITIEALGDARQAMRMRKGLDGKTIISAAPKYLVVGADRETEAEKVLASIAPATNDDANPFAGKLTLLVEPRITDGSWYLFADPARLASLAYAYLSAAQGVQIQQSDAWSTLGTRFRAWLDFGAGWTDWRGAHKNAGD